jgi:tetratricopeptide (TPR) repeat protein
MKIIHPLDKFFFSIFPMLKGKNESEIIDFLTQFYTHFDKTPSVVVDQNLIIIETDIQKVFAERKEYLKAVSLCEKGKFAEAKPILNKLIGNNPTDSDYYRILGQVLSEEGDQEEAIDCLINSLRWDSKNAYALIMMGNIFAKYKNDIDTAKKYYDQALIVNPEDNISINNIGLYLLQQGSYEESKGYFQKALEIDPNYPNSLHALAILSDMEYDYKSAFNYNLRATINNKPGNTLYQNSLSNIFKLAEKIIQEGKGKSVIDQYRVKLEHEGGREIEIISSNNIPYAAKIEFAENYKRENHIVKFKPSYPAIEHLVVHELVHLDFVVQARKEGINQIFYTLDSHREQFNKMFENTVRNYRKMNLPQDAIDDICSKIFQGINTLAYNVPIDLFIEDYLYKTFEDIRPYQLLSLYNLVKLGIESVTDKKILKYSDPKITSWTKIFNLVYALQLKELYGIDLIKDFQATKNEINQSHTFYNEYLEYKNDRKPGEEYELVANWAEDLNIKRFFELEGELQFRRRSNVNSVIESLEDDPIGDKDRDPVKEREHKKFLESEKKIGVNMAVAMFMVSALQYFEGMEKDKIKNIALEIALQGTQGYHPQKTDYKLHSIPEITFSGYQILAYYYVSWALVMPDMLDQLNIPYEEEYNLALSMRGLKK